MNRYNFVILGSKNEIFKTSFKDVLCQENVCYIDDDVLQESFICRLLHRFCFSSLTNKFIHTPFENVWNRFKIKFSFAEKKTLCFVIMSNWIRNSNGGTEIVSYLRRHYPGCKVVWFAQDILKTIRNPFTKKLVDVEKLKKKTDLVISYDMEDARKYGLEYHPTVLSKVPILVEKKYQSDVFFIGKSKKRLDLLVEISKGLKNYGVNCNFMVLGIPKEEQKEPEYIHYIEKPLTYAENLYYAQNAKCLLELMQPDAVGYTFRTSEALLYGKKLVTNNIIIRKAPFYNEDGIIVLEELSSAFFEQTAKKIQDEKTVQYENIDLISPRHLLDFVEDKLKK